MKKIELKSILVMLLVALISSGVTVAAVTLTAKDIPFTSTDEEWEVNNLEDAVNELYNVSNSLLSRDSEVIYKNNMQTNTTSYHYHDYVITLPEGKKKFFAVVTEVADNSVDVPLFVSSAPSITYSITNLGYSGVSGRYSSSSYLFTITTDGTGGTINIKPYLQASGGAVSYITVIG